MTQAAAIPGAARAVLSDGQRQHFQHGPIDLVIEAFGNPSEVQRAYDQAWHRFETVLSELVGELALLRADMETNPEVVGPTAKRMVSACQPHAGPFVTPMAAVAGAVADETLAALVASRSLQRAYVNNGGDIALYLAAGETFTTGLVTLGETPTADGTVRLRAEDGVRGIATSGWRGRSLSRGIADSVTVLAPTAAAADVAATLIANAVIVDTPAIRQAPARDLDPDSDLGDRPVTVDVGALSDMEVQEALDAGAATARAMCVAGTIQAAYLALAGRNRVVGSSHTLIDLKGQQEAA